MDTAKIRSSFLLPYFLVLAALALAAVFALPLLKAALIVYQPAIRTDALVVMAGGHGDRNPVAARLYHEGFAARLLLTNDGIFSAWSSRHGRNLYQIEWAREYFLKKGVPPEVIELLPFTASGSYHDALNTREYVIADGTINSLLIVTSDYHTRRTEWIFKRLFAKTDIDIHVYASPLIDSQNCLMQLRILLVEMVKFIYYRVRYGFIPFMYV